MWGIPKLFLVFIVGAISLFINTNLWRDLDQSIQMSLPLKGMKKYKKAQSHSWFAWLFFEFFFLQKIFSNSWLLSWLEVMNILEIRNFYGMGKFFLCSLISADEHLQR